MENNKETNRLQYRIDLILSVIFIAVIFVMGVMTVAVEPGKFKRAISKPLKEHGFVHDKDLDHDLDENTVRVSLEGDVGLLDITEAVVNSLDDYIAGNCFAHTELGYVNSAIQYALGKRMVSTGGQQMVTLNTGHLYDLQNYVPMEGAAANIVEMYNTCAGVPFLYVYEHPTVYSDEMMPEGYGVLDNAPRIADEIVEKIHAAGIDMLDSRDILPGSFPELAPYLYRTDQHWSTLSALTVAREITAWLADATGADFDPSRLDPDAFETTTYPALFLGKYGQRVGAGLIAPDDIVTYAPKYETRIRRYTNYLGDITDVTGSFDEAVLKHRYLEPDAGRDWNIMAYFDYGLTENYELFDSPDGADATVLLLKDSFSAPVGAFLSLTCKHVVSVDLRRSDKSLAEWYEEVKPDAVVLAYSLQMLRDDQYEFQ